MMVVRDCQNIDGGLPPQLYSRMMFNIVLDFLIGLVPFVGDLADAIYKCNTRNAILLEKYLRDRAAKPDKARQNNGQQNRQEPRPVDPSIPEEFDRYEGMLENPHIYTADTVAGPGPHARDDITSSPTRPPPALGRPDSNRDRGWFGGRKQGQGDLETGIIRYT